MSKHSSRTGNATIDGLYSGTILNTKLPILGEWTAKFSLNGKIILIQNALHVPDLHNPLYSLQKHKSMPGCGTFSHFDSGSYILFPTFQLCNDDSLDNIISYESIGRAPCDHIDYAKPHTNTRNTTAHVIPPDEPSASPTSKPSSKASSSPTEDVSSVITASTMTLTRDGARGGWASAAALHCYCTMLSSTKIKDHKNCAWKSCYGCNAKIEFSSKKQVRVYNIGINIFIIAT